MVPTASYGQFGIESLVKKGLDAQKDIAESIHRTQEKVHWSTSIAKMVQTIKTLQSVNATIGSLKDMQEQIQKDGMAISNVSRLKAEALQVVEDEFGLGYGASYFSFHDWYMNATESVRTSSGHISVAAGWENASRGTVDMNNIANSIYMDDVIKARALKSEWNTQANANRMAARAKYRIYTLQKMQIFTYVAKKHGLRSLAGFDVNNIENNDKDAGPMANDHQLNDMIVKAGETLKEARRLEEQATELLHKDPMSEMMSMEMKKIDAINANNMMLMKHVESRRGRSSISNRYRGQNRTYRATNRQTKNGDAWRLW